MFAKEYGRIVATSHHSWTILLKVIWPKTILRHIIRSWTAINFVVGHIHKHRRKFIALLRMFIVLLHLFLTQLHLVAEFPHTFAVKLVRVELVNGKPCYQCCCNREIQSATVLMDQQRSQQEVVNQKQSQEDTEFAPYKEHFGPVKGDIGIVDGSHVQT